MRLLFLVFTFFAISLNISYAKDSLQLGGYKADNCDVIIFLEKQNELFSYRVESEELNFSGQVSFSDNNLIFSKFRNYIDKNFVSQSSNYSYIYYSKLWKLYEYV